MPIVRPTGLAGTWAGGAFTDIDEITAVDTDYIWSDDNSNSTGSVTFDPIASFPTSGTCTLRLRHAQADGGTAPSSGGSTSSISSIAVEGTTVWSTGVNTSEGSFADLVITFDASTITASGTFQVDINYSGGGGSPTNRRGIAISWMEFEYPAVTVVLTAETGSFTLSGQDVNLLRGRILTADTGSFTLSGQDVTLTQRRVLFADTGSFSLAGQDVTLSRRFVLFADTGSFSLAGQDVNLVVGTGGVTLVAETGSFTLSGQDVTFNRPRSITADTGSFSLSGQDVALRHGRILTADTGSFSLAGQDVTLTQRRVLFADTGSFTLSGQDVALRQGYRLVADTGIFNLAGQPVDLIVNNEILQSSIFLIFADSTREYLVYEEAYWWPRDSTDNSLSVTFDPPTVESFPVWNASADL